MAYAPFAFINSAESATLEVKKATGKDGRGELPSSFFESYSAMANTHGGMIVLGAEETPGGISITGLVEHDRVHKALWDSLNDRKKVSANVLQATSIHVLASPDPAKRALAVMVPRAPRSKRPVYIGLNPFGGTYRRRHTGDYRCDDETVRRMLAEQVVDDRDGTLIEGLGIRDLDESTIRAYRTQLKLVSPSHSWNEHEDLEFLRCIGAWGRDLQTSAEAPTIAGLLMFGRLPSILQVMPNFILDYQERSSDADHWVDRVTTDGKWSGNLFDFYRIVFRKLTTELKIPFRFEGVDRVDETPVHQALREAFVNCLIHADYSARLSVLVLRTADSFYFRNPGTMRVPLAEALRGGQSDCRNRKIQKMFQLAGLGEQSGLGIPRIIITGSSSTGWRQRFRKPTNLSRQLYECG